MKTLAKSAHFSFLIQRFSFIQGDFVKNLIKIFTLLALIALTVIACGDDPIPFRSYAVTSTDNSGQVSLYRPGSDEQVLSVPDGTAL
jgi:hypothetical protein